MIRPPAFIRRWRKRERFTPISHEAMARSRAYNRGQSEKREKGGPDARS